MYVCTYLVIFNIHILTPRSLYCSSKVLLKEGKHAALHIHAVLHPLRCVPLVREQHQVVGLAGGHKGVHQSGCVPEMHIFVDHTVDQHQPGRHRRVECDSDIKTERNKSTILPSRGPCNCRPLKNAAVVVTFRVEYRSAHISLCVRRVVTIPRGNRSSGDSAAEDRRIPAHRHGTQIAAVAPAVYTDTRKVHCSSI